MELSSIQKEILIILISLYREESRAIKGEEIADILKRNPGTVRNQMQALKAIGLVDGIPGPKGGYTPTILAYRELNLADLNSISEVPMTKCGQKIKGVNVSEIDFTTLCHPDLCHAYVTLIGSVKMFEIGDDIAIGPTPVNKLMIKGRITGKDEVGQKLFISISEMISLPKKPIRDYMSSPLIALPSGATFIEGIHLLTTHKIHGAPVIDNNELEGIVTLSDIARGLDEGMNMDSRVDDIMTSEVVQAPPDLKLFEVIEQFIKNEIGRLIVVDKGKPIGILTQSDIIRIFLLN